MIIKYSIRIVIGVIVCLLLATSSESFAGKEDQEHLCENGTLSATCDEDNINDQEKTHTEDELQEGSNPGSVSGWSKRFRCDQCGYSTLRASDLADHKNKHTGNKPYKCDQCPYEGGSPSLLRAHKSGCHEDKPYKCDYCPFVARSDAALSDHKNIHTGNMPYKCDQCDYTAANSASLYVHRRKHNGMLFKCDQCDYAPAKKSDLVRHTRRVHGTGSCKRVLEEAETPSSKKMRIDYLLNSEKENRMRIDYLLNPETD